MFNQRRIIMDVRVKKLNNQEQVPMELLLTADPSEEIVNDYLERGICYVGIMDEDIIGVFVLLRTRPETIELLNVAVDKRCQRQGIGKKLVLEAIDEAMKLGMKTVEVGTGNSSIDQLAFYQKCGFRIIGVDFDFFVRNYKEEIYENGIRCSDMIRLRMDL
jgi:ribosomal protein S18 acetylase RimI-like enzyme